MIERTEYNGRECELWSREKDSVCTLATEEGGMLYVLILEPGSADSAFRTRVSLGGVDRVDPILSARTIADYQQFFSGFQLQPQKQYLEVGAGLGEPLVALARQAAASQGALPKPIAIDPVAYELVRDLFGCMEDRYGSLAGVRALIDPVRELRARCDVLLDPDMVRLIRLPLEEAVVKHPELQGCADVVVDLYGAAAHVKPSKHADVFGMQYQELRQKFLRVVAQERALLCQTNDPELWVHQPRF